MRGTEDHNPREECGRSRQIREDGARGFRKVRQLALALSTSLLNNPRVTREIERILKEGENMLHIKYNEGKVERYKMEIREILATLNAPGPLLDGDLSVGEGAPRPAPVYPRVNAIASSAESGKP
jgi:hypothetical protein